MSPKEPARDAISHLKEFKIEFGIQFIQLEVEVEAESESESEFEPETADDFDGRQTTREKSGQPANLHPCDNNNDNEKEK